MGLDMFLYAVNHSYDTKAGPEFEMGYWRKHPDLHGFIVNEFAGGKDECQEIPLTLSDLKKILQASEEDKLPHTDGFFFGASSHEYKERTRTILQYAIQWLEERQWTIKAAKEGRFLHPARIFYQASW